LEAMEWNKSHPIVIPSSLIVLIRDRLCGPNPDWHEAYRSREEKENAAFMAAQLLKPDEKISGRKLAALVGVSPSKAARWLAEESFQRKLEEYRKLVASDDFKRRRDAFIKNMNSKEGEVP
jgi:hypothetical protein